MPACTFFGHRDCPSSVRPELSKVLTNLIENYAVDIFYVGQQGNFDALVQSVLKELLTAYPHIRYAVVLDRMPPKQSESVPDHADTLLPEGIETIHPRFAISWRNKWMLNQSDYVVTYIAHSWGGAAKFAELAARQKKRIINIFHTESFPHNSPIHGQF